MNTINYQKETDKIIDEITASNCRPSLLLHACCAPCSSYCMEYLRDFFDITVFYYNPNIASAEEYEKRLAELVRLVGIFNEMDRGHIEVMPGEYEPEVFHEKVRGYEACPEGGSRCGICFGLRLDKAYEAAAQTGADYVTTTLTISPLKNAALINTIGYDLEKEKDSGVLWLPSDFKKKDGYKRSIELSAEYGLYRQNYCGCEYSMV